ncbi:MAG: tripartite tricarboxylate transporter substrate binding protein [Rhizobiales bacterium]|jgi:tripartite-type tricarboxylate transporter receptor subunit TctC|nr:tripartite tricarboxylate transporter substrate binding protein [Hyphomicrobiales bacterium]
MIVRRALIATAAAFALAAGWTGLASAQSYPSRIIKVIVPFTPGSPNDVLARLLTQHLQSRLGQSIVVENKPGGGTTIGTKAAAMADPDGYTLLFVSSALVLDPVLHGRPDYDPRQDFAPIAVAATAPWVLVISPTLPAKTADEFVAYTKAKPGTVSFGYAQGTASQFVVERFAKLTKADILGVPYKGGAAAVPDFLSARIQMMIQTPSTSLPLIRQNKMRPIAITSAERNPDLPDVPTMRELKLPSLTLEFWAGMLAPAGTPPAIVERLNAAITEAQRSPEMVADLKRLGFTAKIGSAQAFSAFIGEEMPRWTDLVKSSQRKGN